METTKQQFLHVDNAGMYVFDGIPVGAYGVGIGAACPMCSPDALVHQIVGVDWEKGTFECIDCGLPSMSEPRQLRHAHPIPRMVIEVDKHAERPTLVVRDTVTGDAQHFEGKPHTP
jgi:Zn ribbon nucleic-acid-binding protein